MTDAFSQSETLIRRYYDAFNRGDQDAMLACLADDVVHDVNQGERRMGKERFRAFLALRSVGLEDKLDAFPLQLSGGEQQRVAIARALINEPELVLADEPTGNLDPDRAAEVMALFEQMCATKGTTVLVATHDREMIERMKKRVITLVKGQVADVSS